MLLPLESYFDTADEILLRTNTQENVYCPIYTIDKTAKQNVEQLSLQSGICRFRDISIIGQTDVIFNNTRAALDIAIHADYKWFDLSQSSHPLVNNKKIWISYKKLGNPIKRGVYVGGMYSYNYYHFMVDHLSKAFLLEGVVLNDYPIIVDAAVFEVPQFKDLLIKVFPKKEFITIEKNTRYEVADLIYPYGTSFIPYNIKDRLPQPSDCINSKEAITFLKSKLIGEKIKPGTIDKIFLARKGKTRTFNSKEIEAVFHRHGFKTIHTDNMTIDEQIVLFSGATFIAGPTGASFTNLLFCKPGAKALIFAPQESGLSCFSNLAGISQVKLTYYCGEPENPADLHSAYYIDPSKLEKDLTSWL